MTTAWVLNVLGLFFVTAGALLMFLYFRDSPKFTAELPTPEAKHAYDRHRRLSTVAMGLLAAWLVLQYVGFLI